MVAVEDCLTPLIRRVLFSSMNSIISDRPDQCGLRAIASVIIATNACCLSGDSSVTSSLCFSMKTS